MCLSCDWIEMFLFQLSYFPISTFSKLPFIACLMKQIYRKWNVLVKFFKLFKCTINEPQLLTIVDKIEVWNRWIFQGFFDLTGNYESLPLKSS
jgi:hypothetical protein